ncbi:MAG: sulfatase-like hydrolase/transferase [Verrucomicrobia bacterium]|nr:sulfatase-like hydrolase/transferase [Verrucomicrobiota bacterium]
MKSSFFLSLAALALLCGGWGQTAGTAENTAAARPNILFLFTDDQRADTIGALGNPHIRTPHLDSLARGGFVFHNAYCLGANIGAVCTPSRNMLLSGRAYFRWKGNFAAGNDPNFPVSIKQAGYLTYHHGKRGNTAVEIQAKFDHNLYINEGKERVSGQPGKAIVDAAMAFLKTNRDDRPFFMYLAFESPHDPRVAAKEFLELYDRGQIPLPKNYLPQHPFHNGEQVIRDELLAPWPRTPDEIRRHLHEYYAVISGLDHHIGRLLQCLKDLGKFDNTIIIFSSDHGLAIGSHGLMGKQNLYEDGMKAPLFFTGPGIPKGRSEALAYLFDIFPTVCDWVGAPIPAGLDGLSLKPIIEGRGRGVRDTLFLSYREVQRAIRDDRWKLIRYPRINKTQLFDLQNDPYELRSLADDSSQAGRIERLMSVLRDWQRKLGDTAALASDDPQNPAFTPPTAEELATLRQKLKM